MNFLSIVCYQQTGESLPLLSFVARIISRRYLIAGNWKCNGTLAENKERIKVFNEAGAIPENVDVALCVPDIHIPMVLADVRKEITVGAQNCGNNDGNGAFTGEVGAHQVRSG